MNIFMVHKTCKNSKVQLQHTVEKLALSKSSPLELYAGILYTVYVFCLPSKLPEAPVSCELFG